MADEVMNKKPIIKYLLNGEYKEATVADVGDLSQLKTTVKTTLVDAINALFNGEGSSGSIPEDVQNDINDLQDAVDGLNNGLSGLGDAFENQKVENDQKLQDLLDEINKNINDTKTVIEQTITDVTNEYQTKVDQVTNELNDAKGNIATTIDDLSKVKDELTNIDLNIKNISVVIDEINLQLTSKVEKSDFDLLEAEVKKNTTQITQNAEEIALKASQESLNVATGRIAQNEAQIKVNADKIESKVSQEEVREEIEKIDRFGKNLFHRTREWHNSEWNLNGFTVSSDTYMRCHIVTISENNKPVTQIVDNLVVGDTYNISVYAKADNTTAKVYGKISGVTEPIKMVRVGSSDDTLVGTDFYRLNGSFVATDTTLDIGFIFRSLSMTTKGYLSAGKLEHSALPSDWQPNADDTYEAVIRNESAINQVADEIELVVETTEQQGKDIENNKSSIDVLNDSITLQTEKITEIDGVVKEQGAQLEIAQDQISQKVSQTDIDQSIADIDIDTKNRILNSDFQREFENWNEVNSGFKIVEKDGVKYAHIERTGLTAVQIASMSSDKFLVKPSDRLMFSFDFIVDDLSKLDNKTLFTVELFDIKDVRVDFKNYTISDLHNESVSNGEVARLYSSWEINREDVAKGRIKYNLYQNGSVYFTKAMLQSGQMNSTKWDSAPEDAYIIRGKLESSIEQNAKEIALKVSQVDFDVMGDSVKENTANIQIANDSITNTVKELEKTNEKISANETEIAQTKEQISLKADSLEVDNLEGRMSEAEAQIVLNTEGITQTVKDIETVANTAESIKNIADQAKANADKANSSINEMGQDNKLSPVEKKAISTEWETIKAEYATIKGQADKYSVTSTTYTTAYNSLTSYITTLKLGETTSTTIAPDVFRTQFKTYYSEKVKILNAISDKVKELGDATAQNVKSWAESEIKQTNEKIDLSVNKITEVENKVDNIEIGGRNYFSIKEWKSKPSFNVSNIEAIKISLMPNSQYTLSTNIPNRTDGATCDLFLLDSSAAPHSNTNGVALNKPRTITTLADGIVIVAMRNKEFVSGNWWAMLSKGNKALDWSPAPEDVQGNIDSLGNYTAYANSPDGTVDFITVYPGENILLGSQPEITMIGNGLENQLPSNRYLYFSGDKSSLSSLGFKTGDKITFSAEYEISGSGFSGEFSFRLGSASWTLVSPGKARIKITKAGTFKIQETVDITEDMLGNTYLDSRLDKVPATVNITVRNRKLEKGNNSTPIYTPSPQDDPVKAHMQYIGYSIKDSNDYKDYTWQVNPEVPLKKAWKTGENGEGFTLIENSLLSESELNFNTWNKSDSMTKSTYAFTNIKGSQFRVTGKGTGGYEVLSKEIPNVKTGDEIELTVTYKNNKAFDLYNDIGLKCILSHASSNDPLLTTSITLSNQLTESNQIYKLNYTATKDSAWIMLNFGGVSDNAVVDFEIDIAIQNNGRLPLPKYLGTSPNGGEKWTDYTWALNPEYVAAVADSHISNVKEILESQIDVTAESILNTVSSVYQTTEGAKMTEEQLRSLITQTSSSWGVSLKQIQKDLNTVNGDLVEEINTRSDYMRFYSGTNTPILEIGTKSTSGSSAIKLIITNESIGFISGEVNLDDPMTNALAYFEADKFKINKGIIVESLRVGNHEMQRMNNGHTIFTFVG